MGLVKQLWHDQSGAVLSSELVLVTSLTVAGVLSGLQSIHDAVVGEMSDMASTVQVVSDSYLREAVSGVPAGDFSPAYRQSLDTWENLGIEVDACVTLDEPADPTTN